MGMRTDCRAAAAALLVSVAALAPAPAVAHDLLGANLNFIGDFRRNHEFVDVVKQSRRFLAIGQFDDSVPANLAPVGPDGWPTTDFRILAMAAQQGTQQLAGTYKIVFNGQATLDTNSGGAGTISNKVFDAPSNTTTADLAFPAGAENLMINFTGTGGSVKNLRIIRPGYPVSGTPLLHTPWKQHTERFRVLRFLDWTRTNGNRHVNWADRTTPEKSRTEAYIAQWETVVDAANLMNRDAWINVPVLASNEYVTNLATLLRDRLNPNLNVYVEYGNELWNFSLRDVGMDEFLGGVFNGATENRNLAVASPPDSPIRHDGQTDQTTLGFRRVALRLVEISDIFKTVWGAAAINTRVRPVLAGQMANSFIVSEGLEMVDNVNGLNRRPNTVFYAVSGAPYIFPAAIPDGNADETPGMNAQQILDGLAAGVANAPSDANAYQYLIHAGLGAWYGLKVVAYEAGFDNFGGQNIEAKRAANLDPQIRTICRNLIDQWHSFGFEHLMWFNGGADSYDTQFGMWPVVEDLAVQAPKNQCMDDVLAAALPAVTVGTSVGAPIAGGNYRGSPAPGGSVSGVNSPPDPMGFPGFVEYLLRADTGGTYQLVFTGTAAAASEQFRVKLNNATVASNVSLPTSTGNATAIAVTLRRGLNALRIERQPAAGSTWTITSFAFTLTGDATPDAFTFPAQTNVAAGSVVVSAAATMSGLTTAASVTVSGGEYSVGCNGTFTLAAGTINNGQPVCVRHTASTNAATSTSTTLTVGGISATFTSTTGAAANPPRLANISTRLQVLTGDDVMIGGFIIGGSAPKTVVVRARGPSLAQFGVTGLLANPQLQLFSGPTVIASNDNWLSAANSAAIQAAGFAPGDTSEAAIMMTLNPGAYTAIVSGVAQGTGVGIVEVFEVDAVTVPLINIATRGRVQTGDNVMIGGFIIQGDGPQTVVVRARGPSLAQFGVPGLLANPQLQLFSGPTVIGSNDDWQQAGNANAIQAAGFAPSDNRESAIMMTLNPGAYTAIVSGVGGTTGVAIVEVFTVP
jgi:hypothetical protein